MGYYMRGDYYARKGDYYRGDFWSTVGGGLKKAAGVALGAATGFITGGPMGAVQGGIGALTSGGKKPITSAVGPYKPLVPQMPGLGGVPIGAMGKGKPLEAGGRRRRRMNVTNPKALRRAIRRGRGFEKLAMKVLGFTRPHKPKGRPYFKKSRAK